MSNAEAVVSVESWVMAACRELGLPVGDGDDNFFTIGGNSLTAVKLIAKAEEEFGEDALPADDLFDRSSIHDIALTIVRSREQARVLDEPLSS